MIFVVTQSMKLLGPTVAASVFIENVQIANASNIGLNELSLHRQGLETSEVN